MNELTVIKWTLLFLAIEHFCVTTYYIAKGRRKESELEILQRKRDEEWRVTLSHFTCSFDLATAAMERYKDALQQSEKK